jgi:hypothetical protein
MAARRLDDFDTRARRRAAVLRAHHGADARVVAVARAREALDQGDTNQFLDIAAAAVLLLTEPPQPPQTAEPAPAETVKAG